MRRFGWLGIAALLAAVLTSCDGSSTDRAARSKTPTFRSTSIASSPTSTTTIPPQRPSEVAHLGGALAFTESEQLATGPETAAVDITLDNVIDPGPRD
jgi:hypothetical protein